MPEIEGGLAIAEPTGGEASTETVETQIEGGADGGSGANGAESSSEVDSPQENEELTPKSGAKTKLSLAEVVKTKAEALKAIDPQLPAALRTAAFEQAGLYREFPGGLKEAVGLKQAFAEIGGAEGAKELQEAVADYVSIEQLFEKGDGSFMDRLAEALPASFSQIMPAGLAKWKAVDPEMYEHSQAKVLIQTVDQFRLSETLESLWNKATDEPTKNALAHIWQQVDAIRQKAAKAPERKVDPQNEALTRREQELAQRETQALLAPIANSGRQQIQTITDREMTQSYQWDKTDPSVKEAVQDRVRAEVVNASKKDKIFLKEFDRLKDRKDAAGLDKHVKNFQDRVTPSIVQRVAKLFAVKPKNAGAISIKKPIVAAANGNGKGATPPANWVRWNEGTPPRANLIDYGKMGRNADDMILAGKYILKDGRHVLWG
jgi:hypothetical protein